MHYWLHFFARLRRTGTAKIADYLDDGSFAREEPNNFSFKFKNETETLEMKSKEKSIGDFKQNWPECISFNFSYESRFFF